MKYVFLLNPVAGAADSTARLTPQIQNAAREAHVPVELLQTKCPGHARELAEKLVEAGEPVRVYTCGGDGTFNEAVQAAVGHPNLAVGCVPCGSGNDFVRNFGTPEEFLDLSAQLSGETVPIDVIETTYGYSAAICAAGLDAQVAYGIPKFRRIPFCGGTMAYTLSIVQTLFSKLGNTLDISIDEEKFSGTYMMMAICNGRLYGGGYMAAPTARMDDGLLDVVLVKPIPRVRIPGFLKLYKTGDHLKNETEVVSALAPYMTFRRAKRVQLRVTSDRPLIVTVDGECAPRQILAAAVKPQCLNVILPQALARRSGAISKKRISAL